MSVLRSISIIILNLLLILESSSLSVLALADEDVAVNSLEALSLPIATIDQEIASTNIKNTTKEIQPELKMDIQSLLDANRAYATTNTTITETGATDDTSETHSSSTEILTSLDGSDVFGDFLIASDARLIE